MGLLEGSFSMDATAIDPLKSDEAVSLGGFLLLFIASRLLYAARRMLKSEQVRGRR